MGLEPFHQKVTHNWPFNIDNMLAMGNKSQIPRIWRHHQIDSRTKPTKLGNSPQKIPRCWEEQQNQPKPKQHMTYHVLKTWKTESTDLRVCHWHVSLPFSCGKQERWYRFTGIGSQGSRDEWNKKWRNTRSFWEATNGIHQRICEDSCHCCASNQVAYSFPDYLSSGRVAFILVITVIVILILCH